MYKNAPDQSVTKKKIVPISWREKSWRKNRNHVFLLCFFLLFKSFHSILCGQIFWLQIYVAQKNDRYKVGLVTS